MRVLVACEYSQTVCQAFRAAGHEAYSCDILPTEGNPAWHIQGDVREFLNDGWDMMLAYPDCTYLTVSAEWAYSEPPYHQKVKPETLVGEARREAREQALDFVRLLMNAPIEKIAIENPIGAIGTRIRPADQIIQPWAFGDDASKATCLWLKNLPLLQSTQCVAPRLGAGGRPVWGNQTATGQNRLSPSEKRGLERARTFPGIAKAKAEQWGNL